MRIVEKVNDEMLPYTKRTFEEYVEGYESDAIVSSDIFQGRLLGGCLESLYDN